MQISASELHEYRETQAIAKSALRELQGFLKPGVSEAQIAARCDLLLHDGGADSSWYHGVGAMVFVGERTGLSMSGRDYVPSQVIVQETDLVTVDVSPERSGYWGDFARSFVIGESEQILDGMSFVDQLHDYIATIIRADLEFENLFEIVNRRILDEGYENLDFRGNLGHTIEKRLSDRKFIEAGMRLTIREAGLFTFEPHVRKIGGKYGFRREDIYYLSENSLVLI